jgi:hypothetical protein
LASSTEAVTFLHAIECGQLVASHGQGPSSSSQEEHRLLFEV